MQGRCWSVRQPLDFFFAILLCHGLPIGFLRNFLPVAEERDCIGSLGHIADFYVFSAVISEVQAGVSRVGHAVQVTKCAVFLQVDHLTIGKVIANHAAIFIPQH